MKGYSDFARMLDENGRIKRKRNNLYNVSQADLIALSLVYKIFTSPEQLRVKFAFVRSVRPC